MVNFDYPGLSLSDQRFTYYNGTISAKFDKSTGNMVYAHYDYPVIIELTAHLLGSNTRVKVGMTTINDFTIKYKKLHPKNKMSRTETCGAFCVYFYLSELPSLNAFATASPRTT